MLIGAQLAEEVLKKALPAGWRAAMARRRP
jgi:hypothetical protein